jgi:predicted component of type VI protein secretion system
MELSIEISEKDLADFGKETIQKEIREMLRWLKIKQSFRKLSKGLESIDPEIYQKELEEIRKSAWNEYKKDISL